MFKVFVEISFKNIVNMTKDVKIKAFVLVFAGLHLHSIICCHMDLTSCCLSMVSTKKYTKAFRSLMNVSKRHFLIIQLMNTYMSKAKYCMIMMNLISVTLKKSFKIRLF